MPDRLCGEFLLQTAYACQVATRHAPNLGRELHVILRVASPPDEMVKPEYREKIECRVCKDDHLPECAGGYNMAYWSLQRLFYHHTHFKNPIRWSLDTLHYALQAWREKYLISEEEG
jgi:hypothetical protein